MITYQPRLPIRLVAYNAEHTWAPVPDRLPTMGPSEDDGEVLIIDDSTRPRAFFWLNQALIRINPDLFSDQIFVRATVTLDVSFVVRSTRASIEAAAA